MEPRRSDIDAVTLPKGLSTQEARARLKRDGPNVLPSARGPSPISKFAAQLVHFFALLLWVAGLLAFLAGMPQLGVAIFVVVILNGTFAFAQETRAERAAERLVDLLPRRAIVVRDGRRHEIPASEIVTEDLLLLGAGDRVTADVLIVDASRLSADTSMLTGESEAIAVEIGAHLFAGSFVVEGEAAAVVQATGSRTRLAAIALLTRAAQRPRSPMAVELDRVVRTVAFIALGVGIGFFAIALVIGTPAADGFVFAIGVTVALVPEGLLPTVTLSLAIGAQRMAERNALIRRLESVETLGSTTFICTDKTGTLTRNEMSVVEIWIPQGRRSYEANGYDPNIAIEVAQSDIDAVQNLGRAALRCSTGQAAFSEGKWIAQGDPMEAAIDTFARRLGFDRATEVAAHPDLHRFPFDPRRRAMSVVADNTLFAKGAPDALIERCRPTSHIADALEAIEAMSERGLRVLAVAQRPVGELAVDVEPDDVERDLELLGILGLEDPPRANASAAIAACRRAGIRVAMMTGDHPATATAIAREVGLLTPEGLASGSMVFEGHELPTDEHALGAFLDRDGIVIARLDPEAKLAITRALQARGHVVAMTGDGVNDGPALQAADIGIAMGRSGTDVAREAADLVLLDDDFATIVHAIEQGRATFSNVRRFLTYHLTDNVAELTPFVVWALSGGSFPLALGVLQILFLDIGTDILPALALGAEAPNPWALQQPPTRRHLIDPAVLRRVFGVLGPTEALFEMAAFLAAFLALGWRPGDAFPSGTDLASASGAAFTAVVIGQCANAFACRSATRLPGKLGWTSNKLLISAICVELVVLVGFITIGPFQRLLDHSPPPPAGLAVALLCAPAVLIVDALHKRRRQARPLGIHR